MFSGLLADALSILRTLPLWVAIAAGAGFLCGSIAVVTLRRNGRQAMWVSWAAAVLLVGLLLLTAFGRLRGVVQSPASLLYAIVVGTAVLAMPTWYGMRAMLWFATERPASRSISRILVMTGASVAAVPLAALVILFVGTLARVVRYLAA